MNDEMNYAFMSDNAAPVHKDVMYSLIGVNARGHMAPYGDDDVTADARRAVQGIFGSDTEVFFVFGGTGANVLGLSTMLRPYDAVICADSAHINQDEAGAPERFTGSKLIAVPHENGKLAAWQLKRKCFNESDVHHVRPKVVSVSQPTEYGTVYSGTELLELSRFAHMHGMYLHVDGARIANADVSDVAFRIQDLKRIGVDVVTFGGTKNGMMFGEAVVFFNKDLSRRFGWVRKQGMQLPSKMRYVAAQFRALLRNDLWLENARHANAMAKRLGDGIRDLRYHNHTTRPVQSNAVFTNVGGMPLKNLMKKYACYLWDGKEEVRLMTSWATTEQDVDELIAFLDEHSLPDLHSRKY